MINFLNFNELDKVLIVAELSANHNGSLSTAIKTICAAKRAGADAVKLQTYRPDTITIDSERNDFVIKNGDRVAQIVFSKFEKINWFNVNDLSHTNRGSGGFGSTGNK